MRKPSVQIPIHLNRTASIGTSEIKRNAKKTELHFVSAHRFIAATATDLDSVFGLCSLVSTLLLRVSDRRLYVLHAFSTFFCSLSYFSIERLQVSAHSASDHLYFSINDKLIIYEMRTICICILAHWTLRSPHWLQITHFADNFISFTFPSHSSAALRWIERAPNRRQSYAREISRSPFADCQAKTFDSLVLSNCEKKMNQNRISDADLFRFAVSPSSFRSFARSNFSRSRAALETLRYSWLAVWIVSCATFDMFRSPTFIQMASDHDVMQSRHSLIVETIWAENLLIRFQRRKLEA